MFRPLTLNPAKTLEVIKKFEMVIPSNEAFNTFELKFLRPALPNDMMDEQNTMAMMKAKEITTLG